jgi:DNA-binding CsgD family transcriptional regulator
MRSILGELVPKGTSLEDAYLRPGFPSHAIQKGFWPFEARRRFGELFALGKASSNCGSCEMLREEKSMVNLEEIKITPRDEEVLQLLVQGCSNKEIAVQLRISPRTVKQHLRTLFLRAGIRDGRKRVKLATAMFQKERKEVCSPATV